MQRVQLAISGAALSFVLASIGCSSNTSTTLSTGPQETLPTRTASPERGKPAPAEIEEVVRFGGDPREPMRSDAIVGIYGESISRSFSTVGFGDGSSNIDQLTFSTEGADFDPDVDPAGRWVYFASTQHRQTADIYRKPLNGSTITQLTSDPADDMMPEVSPDGTQIAFCSNRAGQWDIYTMPIDGGQPRSITSDTANEIHPSWSSDGRQLVYCKFNDQNGRWELWTVDVNNTSVRHFIDYGFLPEWSPDPAQNKILFQRARNRGSRYHSIWTIDLINGQGRNPTEIVSASNAAVINPTWSLDGGHIAFVTVLEPEHDEGETPSQSDLWLVQLDGTNRVTLTSGNYANFQPTFGRDGRVVFVSNRSGQENLWTVSVDRHLQHSNQPGSGIANVPTGE